MTVKTLLRELWDPKVSSDFYDLGELRSYWIVYGGLKAVFDSVYFLISLTLMVFLAPFWCSGKWVQTASDLLPGLLGFSIGALAIMLAVPGFKVFDIIAENGDPRSHFLIMASRLVHFIVVQVMAIILMVLARTYPNAITNGIGFILMTYALLTAVAVSLTLFGLARMLNFAAVETDD